MPDSAALIVTIAGCVIVAGGLAWFLIWSLARGYFRDLAAPALAFFTPQRGLWPTLVMLAGGAVAASPLLIRKIAGEYTAEPKTNVPTPPRDTVYTLTTAGVDKFDMLKQMTHIQVLRWANPAVTDAHLDLLADLKELTELDLSDTQITDAGLAKIAALPRLAKLRLARTRITDAGFRQHILNLKLLDDVDLMLTGVKAATADEWTDAKIGRRRPSL